MEIEDGVYVTSARVVVTAKNELGRGTKIASKPPAVCVYRLWRIDLRIARTVQYKEEENKRLFNTAPLHDMITLGIINRRYKKPELSTVCYNTSLNPCHRYR